MSKICDLEELTRRVRAWQAEGKRVVTTNGCFDLLHVGHLRTLQWARGQGDVLVVLLNSDSSTRALKGPSRPLVDEEERAELLAGLECVDALLVFSEATPIACLSRLRAQVHVKGGDYRPEQLPETPVVESWGGRVLVTPLVPGRSSSLLEKRLNEL